MSLPGEPSDLPLPDGTTTEVDPADLEVEVDGLGVVVAHANKADSRLIERFKKDAYRQLLKAFADELQEVESMLWQVLLSRYVDNAFGKSLDYIGNRVGEGRQSLNDPDFRVRIKARILINRSQGRAEDIMAIARVLGVHARVRNTGNASMRADITETPENTATRQQIAELLGEATSGGVRLHVSIPTNAAPFRLGFHGGPTSYGGKLASVSATIPDAGHLTDGRTA